jgi:hypothetical protein
MKAPTIYSCRGPERKQYQAGEIPGVLDQGQGPPVLVPVE